MDERKIEVRVQLGQQIAQLREEQGWTQAQLAKMAGVTEQNIQKIEEGRYNVPLDIIGTVAYLLGCEVSLIEKL